MCQQLCCKTLASSPAPIKETQRKGGRKERLKEELKVLDQAGDSVVEYKECLFYPSTEVSRELELEPVKFM